MSADSVTQILLALIAAGVSVALRWLDVRYGSGKRSELDAEDTPAEDEEDL